MESQETQNIPFAGRYHLIQVLEVLILGTADPWDCKSFPPRFPLRQVSLYSSPLNKFPE
jgi:hypothetical protein